MIAEVGSEVQKLLCLLLLQLPLMYNLLHPIPDSISTFPAQEVPAHKISHVAEWPQPVYSALREARATFVTQTEVLLIPSQLLLPAPPIYLILQIYCYFFKQYLVILSKVTLNWLLHKQTSISHLSCNSVPADVCSMLTHDNFCWYNTRYFKVTLWTWIGLQAPHTHFNFAY